MVLNGDAQVPFVPGPRPLGGWEAREAFLLEAAEILIAEAEDRLAVSTSSDLIPGLLAGALADPSSH